MCATWAATCSARPGCENRTSSWGHGGHRVSRAGATRRSTETTAVLIKSVGCGVVADLHAIAEYKPGKEELGLRNGDHKGRVVGSKLQQKK